MCISKELFEQNRGSRVNLMSIRRPKSAYGRRNGVDDHERGQRS